MPDLSPKVVLKAMWHSLMRRLRRAARRVGWRGVLPFLVIGFWCYAIHRKWIIPPADVWRPTSVGDYWLMVSAIAATGLAVAACFGLQSLWLTRRDITLRQQRECRACAVERCKELAQELLPRNRAIRKKMTEQKIGLFPVTLDAPLFSQQKERSSVAAAVAWVSRVPFDLHAECIDYLNTLEVWAAHFMHGLAEHELATLPCAPVFRSLVVQFYPFLVQARADTASGPFPNIVALYNKWMRHLNAQEAQRILGKLASLIPETDLGGEPDPSVRSLDLEG